MAISEDQKYAASVAGYIGCVVLCLIILGVIILVGVVIGGYGGGSSSFLGNFGVVWKLDDVATSHGYESPHLQREPVVDSSMDPCDGDIRWHTCPAFTQWMFHEKEREMGSMRYVHYVLLQANHTALNGDDTFKAPNAMCRQESDDEGEPNDCIETMAVQYPLRYCRLIKNGEGSYREHHARLESLLARLIDVIIKTEPPAYAAAVDGMSIADLCDPWRRGMSVEPVAHTIANNRVFSVDTHKKRITAPSYALFYNLPAWNEEVSDYFWLFHLAHEIAHEVVVDGGELGEEECDERAFRWIMAIIDSEEFGGDFTSVTQAVVSVAQELCVAQENARVESWKSLKDVQRLFLCKIGGKML